VYAPVEREVRRTYSHQLRMVGRVGEDGIAARRKYQGLLGDDFVNVARPEVQGLRDPRKLRIHLR
jgi:hypothetical protein